MEETEGNFPHIDLGLAVDLFTTHPEGKKSEKKRRTPALCLPR